MSSFKVADLIIPHDYFLQKQGVTQSLFGAWKTCRRKFLFLVNRWERTEVNKWAYHSMMHKMLEYLYAVTPKNPNKVLMIKTALQHYILDVRQDEVQKWKVVAEVLLTKYLDLYKKDFAEKRFEAIEGVFSIVFNGYVLRGRKDGRFRDRNNGRWHIEHKNYSIVNEEVLSQHLAFDFQNLFYALADIIEFGVPLKGVLYNIIRKPTIRKKDDLQELAIDLRSKVTKDPDHYFVRYEIPYPIWEIEEFKKDLMYQLGELEYQLKICRKVPSLTLRRFYKNEAACEGRFTCEYLGACSSCHLNGYRVRKNLFPELED